MIDPRQLALIARMQRYAITTIWDDTAVQANVGRGDEWPWFEDWSPYTVETGRTNKILTANRLKKSRLLSAEIEPMSDDVSSVTSEGRKAFWKARFDGIGGTEGSFEPHIAGQFDDYDLLAVGCMYAGLVDDPKSGRQAAALRHVQLPNVVWDRSARSPVNARCVALRFMVPYDDAANEFGKEAASQAKEWMRQQGLSSPAPVVPYIEYYDVGIGGKEPTRCCWLGSHHNKPYKLERNPYGAFIPAAFMVNSIPPGSRFPFGGVFTLMAVQEMINQMERYAVNVMKKGPIDLWRLNALESQDINDYVAGKNNGNITVTDESIEDIKNYLLRIDGAKLSPDNAMSQEHYERVFSETAGLSEVDRGNTSEQTKTLGELNLVQDQTATNRAFDDRQVTEGLARDVEVFFEVARLFDKAPVMVNYTMPDGSRRNPTINDPQDPRMSAANLLAQYSRVKIDPGSLTFSDARSKRLKKLQDLVGGLLPIMQLSPGLAMQTAPILMQRALTILNEDPSDFGLEGSPAMQAIAGGQVPPNAPMQPTSPMTAPMNGMQPQVPAQISAA